MDARDSGQGPLHSGGSAHRLLVLSNRLPELRTPTLPDPGRSRSVGGLVSALTVVLAARSGLWLGWSGRTVESPAPDPVIEARGDGPVLAWVDFSARWRDLYYDGFCNRSLWPLFHTFPARVRFVDEEWDCYQEVNQAFAQSARGLVGADVAIWVHDYHLLLVARELQRLGHRGPVGLFLHLPFPALDLFSMLPWADVVAT